MISGHPRFDKALISGLLLFGLTLPFSKSASNVLLFLIYPAAIAGMIRYADFRQAIRANVKQPLTPAFLLFFAVSLAGVFYTKEFMDGYHTASKFFSMLAIYVMASTLMQAVLDDEQRHQQAEKILLAFMAGLTFLNVVGILTFFGIIGHKKYVLPLSPMNVHHIWFSNISALGIYAAAAFLLFSPRGKSSKGRAFLIAFILLTTLCILLSLSRTAWVGIMLTSAIMGFLSIKKKKIVVISIAAAAVLCVAAYAYIPIVHDRIGMIGSDLSRLSAGEATLPTGEPTSLGARFLMWKAAFTMFLSNPLFGVGTGDYMTTMVAYVEAGLASKALLEFNQPHNLYLFTMATNGLLGLAALLYLFYRALQFEKPFLEGSEKERLLAFVAVAATIHFMIAGLTDSFFNIQILRYAFAFILGISVRSPSRTAA